MKTWQEWNVFIVYQDKKITKLPNKQILKK